MKSVPKWKLAAFAIAGLALVGAGFLVLSIFDRPKPLAPKPQEIVAPVSQTATTTAVVWSVRQTIGLSVQGHAIETYVFGNGETLLVFVAGIHGGYEWNTVLLAWELIDHLQENQDSISKNLKIAVIPALNPDGLFQITGKEGRFSLADVKEGAIGAGRFNGNNVDLNRNFDCHWKARAVWQNKTIGAGARPFSEPESKAIRDYVLQNKPAAAIFWHSRSNAIYGSACDSPMLEETKKIMEVYSKASGYKTAATFDGYEVTGDATDWLASIGVPAFSVELATHKTTEWQKNLAGVNALFEYYSGK